MNCSNRKTVVIKFGGAYITKKNLLRTVWQENIDNLIYIVKSLSLVENYKVVLIIGAGSFGHHEASEYSVKKGFGGSDGSNVNQQLELGVFKTRDSVTTLLELVKTQLINNGLKVYTVSPFTSWKTDNGGDNVILDNIDNIKFTLDNFPNLIPILHGDVCLDNTLGCTIISGDTLIRQLGYKLKPDKCIYVTDVNGVYDKSPKDDSTAKLLNIIKVSPDNDDSNNNEHIGIQLKLETNSKDVTGGMTSKLESAIKVAKCNIHTLIIGGEYTRNEILNTILIDDKNNIKKGTIITL